MQLAPIAAFVTPTSIATNTSKPTKNIDLAVMHLDWAHETAGSAVSDPASMGVVELLGASDDAQQAAELLTKAHKTQAASFARDAANDFESAALAVRDEDPEVATGVVAARGEDAEQAIHDAFTALGMDGRGE